LSSDTKSKLDTTEVELNSLRKDFEQSKRQTKKQQQDQTQTDTKLNRALEEAERYKQQLNKMQQTTKDASEQDKKKIEQLTNENRRLEKQRLELMNAFKRQLKLIDILKKQKVFPPTLTSDLFFLFIFVFFSFISKHRKCYNLLKKIFAKQLNGTLLNVMIFFFLVFSKE
jgi:small-conductance mechanosensitive channel